MRTLNFIFIGLLSLSSFAFADAPVPTKMVGVELVCAKGEDFLAFNLKQSRIWMGKGAFVKDALSSELTDVKVQSSPTKVTSYSGDLYIGFGGPGNVLKISGDLLLAKIPVENKIVIAAGSAKQKDTLFCKAQ